MPTIYWFDGTVPLRTEDLDQPLQDRVYALVDVVRRIDQLSTDNRRLLRSEDIQLREVVHMEECEPSAGGTEPLDLSFMRALEEPRQPERPYRS